MVPGINQCNRPRVVPVLVIVVLTVIASLQTVTAQETVPQAIARGASGRVRTAPSGHPPTLDDALRETDLIVKGIVGEGRARLSDDQRDVYTDYALTEWVVLYQRDARVFDKRAATPRIAVTQLGGTVLLDGVRFTQTEHGLPPLEPGTEVLLLLNREGDRHHIVRTFFGAFAIRAGRVQPLTTIESFAADYRDLPLGEAIDRMVTRIRRIRDPQ